MGGETRSSLGRSEEVHDNNHARMKKMQKLKKMQKNEEAQMSEDEEARGVGEREARVIFFKKMLRG